jgi:hypothetical protein
MPFSRLPKGASLRAAPGRGQHGFDKEAIMIVETTPEEVPMLDRFDNVVVDDADNRTAG